jgi:hypothetical protein
MRRTIVGASYVCLAFLAIATPGIAQEERDNTGTNPVNFTYDLRFITEMQSFTSEGGSLVKHTLEWKAPLGADVGNLGGGSAFSDLGKKFGLRMRAYYSTLSLNDGTGSLGSSTVSGIGDLDARLLWIATINSRWGLVPGMEAFFNTASNDALGSGGTQLAPVVFLPLFNILGPRSLFAPGYQYVFDVSGNTVSRSQIDLYFVWILAGGRNWLLFDPQIILDHENAREFVTVDAEWGFMIVPQSGISGYVRPGMGVGAERPFDWNLEFALKLIWR